MPVRLRPVTRADFARVVRWSQDREFCLACDWTPDLTREEVEAWWSRVLAGSGAEFVRLGIEWDGVMVGYADLANVEERVGRAEFGIAVGERHLWGRGIASSAGQLMLRYAFHQLGLSRVTAQVHAPNVRSLALVRRLGFRQEGVLRRHDTYRGGVVDVIVFGLLAQEFEVNAEA